MLDQANYLDCLEMNHQDLEQSLRHDEINLTNNVTVAREKAK